MTNLEVVLSDGCRLAASALFPEGVEGPLPAIFSFYPYRKDDWIGVFLDDMRRYFAARGYVDVLVDFRGTGASEGRCWDTWDAVDEGRDGAEVVEWIASQPWCDGAVGMWGISYGGITTFDVAAQRPPSLKACLPVFGTPDIYHDFIYPGGVPNAIGNAIRETNMLAMDLAPPTRVPDGVDWRDRWAERLARLEEGDLWSLRWPAHPDFDEHWQRRRADVSAIEAPTFGIGGWNDIFPNGMVTAFEELRAPKKLVMGPWVHTAPHFSAVEPWEWRAEAVRWWDRWLKGEPNGIDAEPAVTFFVQGEGKWRTASSWPPDSAAPTPFFPQGDRRLAEASSTEGADVYEADMTAGPSGALFDPTGTGLGFPLDQTDDNRRYLSYTSAPLAEDLWICGSPIAKLAVTVPEGGDTDFVAKLSEVDPLGGSTHVATGWLNGRHRNGTDAPADIEPGERLDLEVKLWPTAYRIKAGNSLRLSIGCADFPHSFPTATRPTIELHRGGDGGSSVFLPVMSDPLVTDLVELNRPGVLEPSPELLEAEPYWQITRDPALDEAAVSYGQKLRYRLARGTGFAVSMGGTARVANDHPSGGRVCAEAEVELKLDTGEKVKISTRSQITRRSYLMNGRVVIDGVTVLDREWSS